MHFQGMMVRSDYVSMHAFNCSFFCKVVFMMALQCLLFNGVASYCMLLHGNAERYMLLHGMSWCYMQMYSIVQFCIILLVAIA